MTVGWSKASRIWSANGDVQAGDGLRLAPDRGVACWHFFDADVPSYTDLINGIVLTDSGLSAITPEVIGRFGNAGCIHFNGNGRLGTADTRLRRAGDVSIEIIGRMHEPQGEVSGGTESAVFAAWCGGAGADTDATNYLYQISTNATPYSLSWFSEHSSAGTNDTYITRDGVPLGPWFYLCATRIADVARIYTNARLIGTSGTLATPTGGNAAGGRFTLGASLDGYYIHATYCSARVCDYGLSLAEIQATYTATLGNYWPISF